jgi:AbrB family looped-hinge helix DNA binding protein
MWAYCSAGRHGCRDEDGRGHFTPGRCGAERLITVVISDMPLAHSKLTAQGQISVPARVRQKLGVGPGSVLEWDDEDGRIVVRKAGRFTSEEIHRALFGRPAKPRTLAQLRDGIRRSVRRRRARR